MMAHWQSTFPKATAVVAISNTKLSPFFPGAPKDNGLVPKVACINQNKGFWKKIKKCYTFM